MSSIEVLHEVWRDNDIEDKNAVLGLCVFE